MGSFFGRSRFAAGAGIVGFAVLVAACSSEPAVEPGASDTESTSTTTAAAVSESDQSDLVTNSTIQAPASENDEPAQEVASDIGVDDETIRVGYSLDLSGPLSSYDATLLDGHLARFAQVNAAGGVAGRTIEIVALDNAGDSETHRRNIANLSAPSVEGVVAIGGLSHPRFDQATAAALDAAAILTIGNQATGTDGASPASVISLRPTVCAETATGVAALASRGNEDAELAILSSGEDWAEESAAIARAAADELELEVVLDGVFGGGAQGDDGAALVDELLDSEPDLVWLAGSPPFLSGVAEMTASLEDPPVWVWGGPSANVASLVFGTLSGPSLAEVYRVTAAGTRIDDGSASEARAGLVGFAPELSYADAGPGLLGWEQAGIVVAALEQAALAEDLTRASLLSTGRQIVPEVGEIAILGVELISERNNSLSVAGSSGTEELFTEDDTPNAVASLCS